MGEAARRAFVAARSQGERFDVGLQLAEAAVAARLRALDLPADASPEERARALFKALRRPDG